MPKNRSTRTRKRRSAITRLGQTALCATLGLALVAVGTTNASAETQTEVTNASWTASDQPGWGSADKGGAFALRGQTDAFAIQSNRGRVNALQAGKSAAASLAVSVQDVLLQDTVSVPSANPLNLHHTLEARRQGDGSTYRGRVQFYTGGKVVVGVSKTTGTAETGLGSVTLPITATAGQNFALQFQVSGTSPVQLSVRAFLVGSTTPNWQFTTSDGSSSRIQSAGGVGIWDYVSETGSAATYFHDDFKSYSLSGTTSGSSTGGSTTTVSATGGTVYRSANFDAWPAGKVVPSNFVSALGGGYTKDGPYDDMTVVADSRGSGKVLRTTLKAGTIHSKPIADGGDNLFLQLPQPVDNACISYDIKFDGNFDWSLGGKLPGLEGVAPGVAPSTPTGGNATDQGWSGRAMWLGPKAYSWAGPTNMGVTYMYHPGQAGTYGDNERWGKAFVAGKWHTLKQCYKMNTIGRSDGQLTVWLDGQQVINNSAYVFRTKSEVHITHLIFSIFRGGSTLDWAGSRDGYVDIDNMRVTST